MVGIVKYYNPSKYFGFIESEDQIDYFFRIDTNDKKRKYTTPKQGDKVVFGVVDSPMFDGKKMAVVESCIGNDSWSVFTDSIIEQPLRNGYLKRINDKWSFKVMPEKFIVPLNGPGLFEINTQEKYDFRDNTMVEATLIIGAKGKVSATLVDRDFSNIYYNLKNAALDKTVLLGRITGQNSDVYFVGLLNGAVSGTIVKKKLLGKVEYKKGDFLEVVIIDSNIETVVRLMPANFNIVNE